MNREAIAQLREKILRSTGIELEKYRNQMLIENSVELLLFPKYVLKIILGTLFAFFALWVLLLGWVLFQERFLSAFLLFGLGIILVLANGILFGILRVLDSLAHDLKEILQLTIVTVQQVFKDFKRSKLQLRTKTLELPSVSDMLLGVLFVVMLPTMLGAVRKKVPVIGGLIAFFIDNIFRVLGSQLTKMVSRTEADLKSKVAKKAGALDIKVENLVDQAAERGMVVLEDVGKRSGKIVDSTLRILSIPIRIIAYVLGVISALIAWLFI